MIEYFKELFNKPQYLWSVWDDLSVFGLVLSVSLIIFAIWFLIWFICQKIKERKYFKCEQKINEHYCQNFNNCLFCKHFKKTKIKRKKCPKRSKTNNVKD